MKFNQRIDQGSDFVSSPIKISLIKYFGYSRKSMALKLCFVSFLEDDGDRYPSPTRIIYPFIDGRFQDHCIFVIVLFHISCKGIMTYFPWHWYPVIIMSLGRSWPLFFHAFWKFSIQFNFRFSEIKSFSNCLWKGSFMFCYPFAFMLLTIQYFQGSFVSWLPNYILNWIELNLFK